jgi:hypothetical protein
LPGVITSIAGAATAVTGLIIALNQTQWFKATPDPLQANELKQLSTASTTTKIKAAKKEDAGIDSSKESTESAKNEDAGTGSPKNIIVDKKPIHLSGNPGGKIRLDILGATLESHNRQNSLLSFHFRIVDETGWGQNITGSEFILLIDDIPTATNNNSGVYVNPNAAAETTAAFEVPVNSKSAVLKIIYWEKSVTIPVSLNN